MPNENSQAATEELVTPQVAQVPEQTPVASAQAEPQKEEPINLETMTRIAREEATRIAQSQVAKGENRIQKLIQEKFAALEQTKGTLGLSDEQVAQARQKIVVDAYSAEAETATNVPSQGPDVDQAIQFMNAEIGNVYAEKGIDLKPGDPEFKKLQDVVNASWNDPRGLTKILLATSQLTDEKASRVAKQQENAPARVVSGGETQTSDPSDISSVTDSKELYAMGERKLSGRK